MKKDFLIQWKPWVKIVPRAYFLWPSLLKAALTSVPSGGNLDVRIEAFSIIYAERSTCTEYV